MEKVDGRWRVESESKFVRKYFSINLMVMWTSPSQKGRLEVH